MPRVSPYATRSGAYHGSCHCLRDYVVVESFMRTMEYLRYRLMREHGLSPEATENIIREFAGLFFRPARMRLIMPDQKLTQSALKRRITCDESETACIHCRLAWDLLLTAKRGATAWSKYWDNAINRRINIEKRRAKYAREDAQRKRGKYAAEQERLQAAREAKGVEGATL